MSPSTKSTLIWGGFIVAVVGLLVMLANIGSKGTGGTGQGKNLAMPVSADEHIKGNPDATLTLVEYSDFQCPACAATYPVVKQIAQEYKDTVKLVYRHFPLREIHKHAQLAAQATEAASKQNKFWEMHDVLFNTQSTWSKEQDPRTLFKTYATSIGLDADQFSQDLDSDDVKNKVNADYAGGLASGIGGTPTFFLNGKQISTPGSYAAFKTVIENELSATNLAE